MKTCTAKEVMAYKSLSEFSLEDNSLFNHVDTKTNIFQKLEPVKETFHEPEILIMSTDSEIQPLKINKNNLPSEISEEAHFLPSKTSGISEITLLPIKQERKSCGHYEPCENIICDVNVQHYVDQLGSSPMLAVNIDDSEINAKVSKHCNNSRCDALSIEHNRCRRAIIRLNRCDKSNACDICGVLLKTRKSRIHHGNCRRKNEYRHNPVDGAQILREKMRERELEIMEAVRARKNDYSDPITCHNKAIEMLKNNSELIVIPKPMTPSQSPVVNQKNNTNEIKTLTINGVSRSFDQLLKTIPNITIKNLNLQQNVLDNKLNSSEKNETVSNHNKVDSTNNVIAGDNKFIITTISQSTVPHSFVINDRVLTQLKSNMETNVQNPYIMPVRVLPITNLKSEPSLLHQIQGIPKFCIIADNPTPSGTLIKIPPISNTQSSPSSKSKSSHKPSILLKSRSNNIPIKPKPTNPGFTVINSFQPFKHEIINRRKRIEQKPFKCEYCSKRFLTDWYFRLHIIKHKGGMVLKCSECDLSFSNTEDLNKHVSDEHNADAAEISCRNSDSDVEKDKDDDKCISCDDCGKIFDSDTEIDQHECLNINDLVSSQTNLLISSEN
ncbi:uncharacterized protein LOC141537688 [Cotesia typhae]|uniref:uncharacterized protein LOC141537688 n=1 Tax=Cotesia typhae TaxID=2053667 RepID=UPI003D68379A